MEVVYALIPMVLLFGFLVVVVFIWMAKKGQFDDLDGAAHAIFLIDDDKPIENEEHKTKSNTTSETLDNGKLGKASGEDTPNSRYEPPKVKVGSPEKPSSTQ